MGKTDETYPDSSELALTRMKGMEEILSTVSVDLYGPVLYLLLLQEVGGFDVLALKRVPSEIVGEVADRMGWSAHTLNLKRAEWNRDNKLPKARDILQPYFNEQFAMAVDYLQGAIPSLMYKLIEKAMSGEASYGVIKDALLLAMRLTEPVKQRGGGSSSEEDEEYIKGLGEFDKSE